MTWNYRIMRHVEPDDAHWYAVHEVYYDGEGSVSTWTLDPLGPGGDSIQEIIGDMAWVLAAMTKPVLEYGTGKEVEPAAMLADELQAWFERETADTKGTA